MLQTLLKHHSIELIESFIKSQSCIERPDNYNAKKLKAIFNVILEEKRYDVIPILLACNSFQHYTNGRLFGYNPTEIATINSLGYYKHT